VPSCYSGRWSSLPARAISHIKHLIVDSLFDSSGASGGGDDGPVSMDLSDEEDN
jgi:hypothetical protein